MEGCRVEDVSGSNSYLQTFFPVKIKESVANIMQ